MKYETITWGTFTPGGTLEPNPVSLAHLLGFPKLDATLTITGTWGSAQITIMASMDGASWAPALDIHGQPVVFTGDGSRQMAGHTHYLATINEGAVGYELDGSFTVVVED